MGWNMNNPHVSYWVQHGGGPPADPMGTGLPPARLRHRTQRPAATDSSLCLAISGQCLGRARERSRLHLGQLLRRSSRPPPASTAVGRRLRDALGTPLNAPFAGTIKEADFNGPYGNTVVIQMANGYTYRVAHLEGMSVRAGDKVHRSGSY